VVSQHPHAHSNGPRKNGCGVVEEWGKCFVEKKARKADANNYISPVQNQKCLATGWGTNKKGGQSAGWGTCFLNSKEGKIKEIRRKPALRLEQHSNWGGLGEEPAAWIKRKRVRVDQKSGERRVLH